MARTKEKKKIIHEPSTHEVFVCLSSMPVYSKILIDNIPPKPYFDFLKWLIEINFNKDKEGKIIIKKLAAEYKEDAAKITKWLREIYDDIFDLNYDRPDLFQSDGIKVELYIKHFDNYSFFNLTMSVVPSEFETIRFPFVRAQVGTDNLWVKKVEHLIEENNIEIRLSLDGGMSNRYREFTIDKALFQGKIGYWNTHNMYSFELDEALKKIYRD